MDILRFLHFAASTYESLYFNGKSVDLKKIHGLEGFFPQLKSGTNREFLAQKMGRNKSVTDQGTDRWTD